MFVAPGRRTRPRAGGGVDGHVGGRVLMVLYCERLFLTVVTLATHSSFLLKLKTPKDDKPCSKSRAPVEPDAAKFLSPLRSWASDNNEVSAICPSRDLSACDSRDRTAMLACDVTAKVVAVMCQLQMKVVCLVRENGQKNGQNLFFLERKKKLLN